MTTTTATPTSPPATTIHRGDVFWMGPDDSRGPAPTYSHPYVVVQDDVFNHSRITTVVVCSEAIHPGGCPGPVGVRRISRATLAAMRTGS